MSVTHSALAHELLPRAAAPGGGDRLPRRRLSRRRLQRACRSMPRAGIVACRRPAAPGLRGGRQTLRRDSRGSISGHRTPLFEDRGAGARGCRLDEAALAEATARVEGSLETTPQLLVLNKFGKVECEGGGLRDLIASAIDRGIPVVIGVPQRNLGTWREFAGEFAVELSDDARDVELWLEGLRERSVSVSPLGRGSS